MDPLLVPEAQAEVALAGNDYLLAGVNFTFLTQSLGSTYIGGQLRLGYEHFWNERWSGGATLRVLQGEDFAGYGDIIRLPGNVTPGLLLRHTGKIGSFTFGQRLGAEYAITFNNPVNGPDSPNRSRALARLRFDVERQFSLNEKVALRPRVAYEAVAFLRLQRPENSLQERVVDFGSLRGELGLRLSPRFDLTPWVAYQTSYINTLAQFDANGKQTGGGKLNLIAPVIGLDVRFTFLRGGDSAERKQLPTQH